MNKEWINSNKMKIIAAITIIVVAIIYFFINGEYGEEEYFENIDIDSSSENVLNNIRDTENETIKIYITGEVNRPGVIELEDGDRIEDALEKADGITEQADLRNVNLAYRLEDGQKIYIPNINDNEEQEIVSMENGEKIIQDTAENSQSGTINLNTASVEKLCELPGVGKSLAEKIINYRNENGKFKKIEDLKNVSGIGDKKFEELKCYICVK